MKYFATLIIDIFIFRTFSGRKSLEWDIESYAQIIIRCKSLSKQFTIVSMDYRKTRNLPFGCTLISKAVILSIHLYACVAIRSEFYLSVFVAPFLSAVVVKLLTNCMKQNYLASQDMSDVLRYMYLICIVSLTFMKDQIHVLQC